MRVGVNGTDLWFDVEGAALVPDGPAMRRRPTLLLLHGGPGFDHSCFKPGLSPLAEVVQMVYLDQRGQGRSARVPLESCTIGRMADDAAALSGALGLGKPVVLGHSFGGFVALTMALRHPDAVGGLVLVGTAAATVEMGDLAAVRERGGPEALDAALRVFGGDCSEAAVADFFRLVAPVYGSGPEADGPIAAMFARFVFAPEVAAHFFAHQATGYDVRPRLGEVRAPTLVVVGESDWVCPPAAAEALARGIPGAELLVMSETGHFPFVERPEPFVGAVRDYVLTERRHPVFDRPS